MNLLKHLLSKVCLFLVCGSAYYMIEMIYRQHSHISMFLLAGFLGVFCIDPVNNIMSFDLDYSIQILISTILCTLAEGVCGLLVNVKLGLHVWDYSMLRGTFFFGQCNIIFVFAWALIIGVLAIPLCDWINYRVFHIEPCPYYVFMGKVFYKMKKNDETQ